jgi:hypothetical protein
MSLLIFISKAPPIFALAKIVHFFQIHEAQITPPYFYDSVTYKAK